MKSDKQRANQKKRTYHSIFATEAHESITNIKQIKRYEYPKMGLFSNGVHIGTGELVKEKRNNNALHTDGMYLNKGFRNQGHGIVFYIQIIEHARRIGANRIYSSKSLNKFSRRMWKTKLPLAGYKVVEINSCKCKCRCRKCRKEPRYYIDLGGK